jgi:hypothetical protein
MGADSGTESVSWAMILAWTGLWMNEWLRPIPNAHRPYKNHSSSRILFLLG